MYKDPDLLKHWNKVYSSKNAAELGWYEDFPEQSLNLIKKCNLRIDDTIIDVGCGASLLIDNLIKEGYKSIIAVDLSENAINKLKQRLGKQKSAEIQWIIDDVSNPKTIINLKNIDLWHDRAVLHFLVNEKDRQTYKNALNRLVKRNGYAIIAAFSLQGAKKCSGLDVYRFDKKILSDFLGDNFKLLMHFDYLYKMPSGDTRPYIYTLFKRIK